MTSSPTVSEFGERALIARLAERLRPAPPFVRVDIGDDAAVLEPERGMLEVFTTDSLVEGVHFRRPWSSARSIGHKALAVNLSDLAAMGATPRAALLSLAMPRDLLVEDFDRLIEGFSDLANRTGTCLVGGNLTRSPGPLVVDVTAIGAVRPRGILARRGARPGDLLFVTGTIGGAGAGLAMLESGTDVGSLTGLSAEAVQCYSWPEPRVRMGRIVGRTRAATAAIDLSDGLGDAATRLAAAAGIGAVVFAEKLPVHPAARAWWSYRKIDPAAQAIASGEDYELAFAVPPRRRSKFLAAARRCGDLPVAEVGQFVKEPGAWLETAGNRASILEGFDHF